MSTLEFITIVSALVLCIGALFMYEYMHDKHLNELNSIDKQIAEIQYPATPEPKR